METNKRKRIVVASILAISAVVAVGTVVVVIKERMAEKKKQ